MEGVSSTILPTRRARTRTSPGELERDGFGWIDIDEEVIGLGIMVDEWPAADVLKQRHSASILIDPCECYAVVMSSVSTVECRTYERTSY
jgi:hypothetical protein